MYKWRFTLIGLLCAAQLATFAAPKEKKEKVDEPKRVYMFGTSVNFNDSVVYLTDVQYLDSITISSNGSLQNYAGYSLQLKVYLEGTLGERDQTCAVIYSDKKKKLEKRFLKMQKRHEANANKTLKRIGTDVFMFQRQ